MQTDERGLVEAVRDLARKKFAERAAQYDRERRFMRTCGAHACVSGSRLERIRDMVGGNVMAWKTDPLVQRLGLSALGRDITLAGPAGT